jgi:hypothetical protein
MSPWPSIWTRGLGSREPKRFLITALLSPKHTVFHCWITGIRWRQYPMNSFSFFHISSSIICERIHIENNTFISSTCEFTTYLPSLIVVCVLWRKGSERGEKWGMLILENPFKEWEEESHHTHTQTKHTRYPHKLRTQRVSERILILCWLEQIIAYSKNNLQ